MEEIMRSNVSNKTKNKIRSLFKELIKVYKSKKYHDEIIHVESKKNDVPVFQLRFFKRGEECIYYRILLDQKETSL